MNNRYSWLVKLLGGGLLAVVVSVCYFASWNATADAKGAQRDPLVTAWFGVQVEGGKLSGAFASCSGIGSENETVETKAMEKGGQAISTRMPGRLRWHDVTLTRGVTDDMKLWAWRQEVVSGKAAQAKQKCTITMYNQEGKVLAVWELANAWPVNLTVGGGVEGKNMVTEQVVLAHEGVTRKQ